MLGSDAEAIAWYEAHRDEFLTRTAQVLRKHIEEERAKKRINAPKWWQTWKWTDAFATALHRPIDADLVRSASARMSEKMPPKWRLEEYDDPEVFERLVDRFEDALREAIDELAG